MKIVILQSWQLNTQVINTLFITSHKYLNLFILFYFISFSFPFFSILFFPWLIFFSYQPSLSLFLRYSCSQQDTHIHSFFSLFPSISLFIHSSQPPFPFQSWARSSGKGWFKGWWVEFCTHSLSSSLPHAAFSHSRLGQGSEPSRRSLGSVQGIKKDSNKLLEQGKLVCVCCGVVLGMLEEECANPRVS